MVVQDKDRKLYRYTDEMLLPREFEEDPEAIIESNEVSDILRNDGADMIIACPKKYRKEIFQWLIDKGYRWNGEKQVSLTGTVTAYPVKVGQYPMADDDFVIICYDDKTICHAYQSSDDKGTYKPTTTYMQLLKYEEDPEVTLENKFNN